MDFSEKFEVTDLRSLHSASKFSSLYSSGSTLDAARNKSDKEWERNEDVVGIRDFRREETMFGLSRPIPLKENDGIRTKWVSPVDANKKRWIRLGDLTFSADEDPLGKCPDSSFDLNASLVSLDFGLVSPKRNWSSPPQRIERAQNREWSPHRVIDRPNPENSPGNWVSVKEFCQQSPPTGIGQPVPPAIAETFIYRPPQELRSSSQNTYVVPEKVSFPQPVEKIVPTTKKTSILVDYVPDRGGGGGGGGGGDVAQSKKRPATCAGSVVSGSVCQSSDKVKRIVDPNGRIVKISLLEDYQVPSFGKERIVDNLEKNVPLDEPPSKIVKKRLKGEKQKNLKTKTLKLPDDLSVRKDGVKKDEKVFRFTENEKFKKSVESVEQTTENKTKSEIIGKELEDETKKMITSLENVLKDKPSDLPEKETGKVDKSLGKKILPEKVSSFEENRTCEPEKKKRNVDSKGVQEFIRSQKQKRMDLMKANKKTKVEEREAIKKNLEELRVKTLKLAAAQSKKKKTRKNTIKIVDPGIEDDVTTSLGLKQVKPKVSYNESVLNLRKMTPRTNANAKPSQTTDFQAGSNTSGIEVLEVGQKGTSQEEKEEEQQQQREAEAPKTIQPLARPTVDSAGSTPANTNDINAALKKLAEVLNLKMSERENRLRLVPKDAKTNSATKFSAKDVVDESAKAAKTAVSKGNRQMITIDLETIHSLKEDIKKISENFKVLYEIILKKEDSTERKLTEKVLENVETQVEVEKKPKRFSSFQKSTSDMPLWLQKVLPEPHPYSVYTAFCRKMNLKPAKSSISATSQESSSYVETVSNNAESDFEALSLPSDRLIPPAVTGKPACESTSTKLTKTFLEATGENCLTGKDSGSELSSSILDSDKHVLSGLSAMGPHQQSSTVKSSVSDRASTVFGSSCKDSETTSTVITEITSRNFQMKSMKESLTSGHFSSRLCDNLENLSLSTPNVKLVTSRGGEGSRDGKVISEKSSIVSEVEISNKSMSLEIKDKMSLSESERKLSKETKTDSIVTEIAEDFSDRSQMVIKRNDEKYENAVEKVENFHQNRRTFFQPQMLHLQFQAELTLLETFQQSLSNFLEAERMKTLTEVTKIVYEKAVGDEKTLEREDQGVQTSFVKENSAKGDSTKGDSMKEIPEEVVNEVNSESIKTNLEISEEGLTEIVCPVREESEDKQDKPSEVSERISQRSTKEVSSLSETTKHSKDEVESKKTLETSDFVNGLNKISFQMLERMLKDEELRSEHQLALIKLREKTLNEKVKAELTFLEMKKRALKEGKNDEEHNVSAIKKRQRGILMKYQSEKEEIERLKKMHKIASEERKIMIKQQKQIQQMQLSTKDMLSKLWRREKSSPFRKNHFKTKVDTKSDSQSDVPEELPDNASDAGLTESVNSVDDSSPNSRESDLELSSQYYGSEGESEGLKKRKKTIESSRKTKKLWVLGEEEKHSGKRHHTVDELINWTKRLEEKENLLNEMEKKTIVGSSTVSGTRMTKSLKSVKTPMKDRSTSPFHFPETLISPGDNSGSIKEAIEVKNSSSISEAIPESIYTKIENCEKSENLGKTVSEDISIRLLKTESRGVDYYSESFESPSSYETHKMERNPSESKGSIKSERQNKSVPFKLSLSPRIPSPKGRNSSGSDDSQNFSHTGTETASEQSDLESRIVALREQLRKRKLEAEKLRREQKKVQRERLKVKEQSLLKQIQAYDAYIQKKKEELEKEYEHSSLAISKPLIKQPKVAEKNSLKPLNETEKIKFYSRVMLKSKEKEETLSSQKVVESDSEIQEQIVEASEKTSSGAIDEIKSKLEDVEDGTLEEVASKSLKKSERTESNEIDTVLDGETTPVETSKTIGNGDPSTGSSLKQEVEVEGSLSGSDDHSASIKTMVLSTEKQDAEVPESGNRTDVAGESSKSSKTSNESTYLSDTFESDFEERSSTKEAKIRTESVRSEIGTLEEVTRSTRTADDTIRTENEKSTTETAKTELETEKDESFDVEETPETKSIQEEEVGEEDRDKKEEDFSTKVSKAQTISDSMVSDLLTEALKTFSSRQSRVRQKEVNEEFDANLKTTANDAIERILADIIDDELKIYRRKRSLADKMVEKASKPEKQIVSGSTTFIERKEEKKSTENTTEDACDVISEVTLHDACDFVDSIGKEKLIKTVNSTTKEVTTSEVFLQPASVQAEKQNEIFGQEWFDDDFGLSQSRREAEQLRIQQLQIEQEIQQLQAQREQIPYYYLREIPNKPPPPYTPPGKPLSEIFTSESDVVKITDSAVEILAEEMRKGKALSDIEPTRDFYGVATNDHVKCYKTFLFDLARHIVEEVLEIQERRKEEPLPWNRVQEPLSVFRYDRVGRTAEELGDHVRKRIVVLFEFGRKTGRESFMMRCFKKKRDHIDEILVRESQEEESHWTRFDEEQVAVKNEVALAILDNLLVETTQLINVIFKKKMKSI